MHVKSLKIFCDVVGRRSFSRAAHQNGISQSGASQVVHQLERRIGVKLIDRSKRPFVLTAEGEVYYRGCRKLVQDFFALEEEVRTLHQQVGGLVCVASIYSVGLSHMNRYIQEFLAHYPKANVRLEYQHPDKVYDLVQRDQVDLGLVSYPKTSRTIKAIPWREEPMVLVCAPGHPWACREMVLLEELDGAKVVGFDAGLEIRRVIDRALAERGVQADIVMEFDNIETIKRAIEIDAGVGVLPEPTVARECLAGTLVAVPLGCRRAPNPARRQEDTPIPAGLVRPLGIVCRRGKRLGATARRFIQTLQERAATSSADDSKGNGQPRGTRRTVSAEAEIGA